MDQQPCCYWSFLLGNLSLPTTGCCPKPLSALRPTMRAAAQMWLASGGTGSRARGGDGALGVKAISPCLAREAKQQPRFSGLLLTRPLWPEPWLPGSCWRSSGLLRFSFAQNESAPQTSEPDKHVAQPLPSFHTHTCPGSGGGGWDNDPADVLEDTPTAGCSWAD